MNDNKNKLVLNAIPTLFDVHNKSPPITTKRKLPVRIAEVETNFPAKRKKCKVGDETGNYRFNRPIDVSSTDFHDISTEKCLPESQCEDKIREIERLKKEVVIKNVVSKQEQGNS